MSNQYISYDVTKTLSKLLIQFLEGNPELDSFYGNKSKIEDFEAQIITKSKNFSLEKRQILVDVLHSQYDHLYPNSSIFERINLLRHPGTFTVATGHQLNLMGGPLYFIYKIVSIINLAEQLQLKYPNNKFIPIFWMASEDHDFEEINHFSVGEEKIQWKKKCNGPVGRLSTQGLESLLENFKKIIQNTPYENEVNEIFKDSYISSKNLSNATRFLVNRIFGKDGVIVVDGDDSSFKALFSPHIKNELINKLVDSEITNTNIRLNKIDKNFKIQVNPRPINLFYIKDGLRERIIQKQDLFRVLNTDLSFNLESILIELEKHPERFSPNVIMRPLFQECILPNLSYTGGGSELSYWLQLKSYFDISKVCFPILMHRNSAVITTTKQIHKLDKLDLSISDLFLSREDLITKITKLKSSQKIDFSSQITHLRKQFNKLYDLAKETDASFTGAVAAQEKKQINGLLYLEKRLLKAEKKKYKSSIEQALILQSLLFPSGNLQERLLNFTTFYAFHGEKFIKKLKSEMNPFQNSFSIISL